MKPSIWTPGYLYHRLRLAWFEKRNPELPWLTADSIRFLDEWLQETDRVLEFGSGRSTIWLASRCYSIISVEHDAGWYEEVSRKLSSFENVKYCFAPLLASSEKDLSYLSLLRNLPEKSCELLVNDGRLRSEVALEGISKICPGGLHVLDNAERYLPNDLSIPASRGRADPTADWAEFIGVTQGWRKVWTTNGVTATLLMFKPC